MQKTTFCLGAVLVLFLVFGVYTAQAQDYSALNQMNGKWLKISGAVKGYDFGTLHSTTATADKFSAPFSQQYACVYYDPAEASATLTIYDKAGTSIGTGTFYYQSGTDDDWVAYMYIYLADVTAELPMIAKTKDSATKGTFSSITVYGRLNASDLGASYFGGQIKASITTKVPFDGTCVGYTAL
jgi:hypothetical protein